MSEYDRGYADGLMAGVRPDEGDPAEGEGGRER